MKRWLLALLLACSCGPCCPCGDDCKCDGQEYGATTGPVTAILGGSCYPLDARAAYLAQSRQLFAWSPSGKPYHAAACIVKSSDGKCGSGIYLDYGGMTGVLTCQHVVGNGMSATFSDGKTLSGEARTDKFGHDIAWIAVKHPSIAPLKLSAEAPKAGERVEFVSRGGPLSQLRHWYGKVQSDGERLRVDANITPGDSGGTILNERGEVVGVSTDGATTAARVDGWVVYGGAGSPGYQPIRAFLRRLFTQFCPDGNCPPSYPPPQPRQRERYGDLYPPDDVPEPPREAPEESEPPQPDEPSEPSDDRIGRLEIRIESIEKSQRGEKGDKGDRGDDGKSPSAEEVAKLLRPSLPTAEQISAVLIAKYSDKLRGPPGKDGRNGSDATLPESGVSHVTVVVDRSASYWPRLATQLERARERYSNIRIAAPPSFATELPAIVFYHENGKSFLVRKGERDVTRTLLEIERGELSFLQES